MVPAPKSNESLSNPRKIDKLMPTSGTAIPATVGTFVFFALAFATASELIELTCPKSNEAGFF